MSFSVIIMTGVLLLTLFSPFGVYYGVKIAKKKDYKKHRRIQNFIFILCVAGVFILEGLIRVSGGSGSLASKSEYYGTAFFTITLVSHIIVAVLSYLLWTFQIIASNLKFKKKLPGRFSKTHKKFGYAIFGGLIYTAITALLVYLMTLNLV